MKMLKMEEFINRIIIDLQKEFEQVHQERNSLVIGTYPTHVSISTAAIFGEYLIFKDYSETLNSYISIAKNILTQYKFKISYSNVYPIIKPNNYAQDTPVNFYKKELFLDLQVFYVTDMGEMFRYISYDDEGVNYEKLETEARNNLNKLSNMLSRLDDSMEIYSLRFTSDFGASMLLSDNIQRQIAKKVGSDYLFAIPSASSLLVAKDYQPYVEILGKLVAVDNDVNKISNTIYRFNNGKFEFAVKQNSLQIIK